MELDSLKFNVETKALDDAVGKLKEMRKAVGELNTPIKQAASNTAKLAKEELALAKNTEKLNQEKAKTATLEAKASAAQDKAALVTERLTKATKEQQSVLERQESILKFMTEGYSKGQASVLAMAAAGGALSDELKQVGEVLKTQRQLIGGDPFDKSTAGLISMTNQLRELQYEYRLVGEGAQLTSKQYKELARDQLRITETSIAAGISFEEMSMKLDENKRKFIETATAVNVLTAAEKERERNQRDVLNAQRAVLREDEKIESILRSLNIAEEQHVSVTERATRSIANYERNLRLAGITGEDAAKKLAKYRTAILQVSEAEQKNKVDRLSRALAPQISDVVVSLGSGMNPMTVLLQQGLQVRDLIGLSGVAVGELQVAFKTAASEMVTSIAGTAKALSSLLMGALVDTGGALLKFSGDITGVNAGLNAMQTVMLNSGGATAGLVKAFNAIGMALKVLTSIGVLAAITAIFTLGKALYDVIKQENALAKATNLSGAAIGMSANQATVYSNSLRDVGVNSSDAAQGLIAMTKEGVAFGNNTTTVLKAAANMNTYLGVSIEDTVKKYAELGKKPVEALMELSKATGLVSSSTFQMVADLQAAGDTTGAFSVAVTEMARINSFQVANMKNDYNGFSLFLIELGKEISNFYDEAFKAVFSKGSPSERLQKEINQIDTELQIQGADSRTSPRIKELQMRRSMLLKEQFLQKEQDDRQRIQREEETQRVRLITLGQSAYAASLSDELKLKSDLDKLDKERLKALALGLPDVAKNIQAQMNKMQSDFNEKNKKKGKTPEEKEADKVRKLMGDLNDQTSDFSADFTEKWNLISLAATKYGYSVGRVNQAYAELLQQQPLVKQQMQEEEANLKAIEDAKSKAYELNEKLLEQQRNSNQSLFEAGKAIEEELEFMGLDAQQREQLIRLKSEQAIADKRLALIWEQSIPGNEARVSLLEEEIKLLERGLELRGQRATKTLEVAQQEEAEKLQESVADAITTGLFEGGKAGSKKLRDIIEAELRKPVVIFVQALVSTLMGNNPSTGATGGLGNILTNGKKAWDMVSGIGASFGDSLAFGSDAVGNWLVNNTSGLLNKFGSSLMQNASFIGKFGQMAGNALVGNMLYSGISGGYSISKGLDIAGNIASLFGPIYGAIGGAINRLFGRKLKDVGIRGEFSGDSFSGQNFQFYKGGLLRSNKTVTSAMDPVMQAMLGQQFGAIKGGTSSLAGILGLAPNLEGYTKSIKLSTKGKTEEQIQKELEDIFGGIAEDLAKIALEGAAVLRFGETYSEALTRLATSLKGANYYLDIIGQTMFETSTAGGELASTLVDLFGGVQNLESAVGSYYENFFTAEEKLANKTEFLTQQFEAIGLQLPDTIQQYKDLVNAQDLTTESGQQAFTALMGLSPVFFEVSNAITEVTNSIIDEIKRLRGEILTSSPSSSIAALQSQFAINTAAARAGDTSAIASLPQLSQAIEESVKLQATSAADIVRIQAWLVNSLTETSTLLGTSVPAFASGGLHSGGLRIVGENGPELEATGPSRIFSASQTAGMLNGEGVAELIYEVQMLRAEVRADVLHNSKTARLLDRVIPDGDSVRVSGEVTVV